LTALRIGVAKGLDGLIELRRAWSELFSATLNRAFYNDWRWHAAIARHLVTKNLYYLQVLDGNRLIAVFPLQCFHRKTRGLTIHNLSQPTHPHIVLADVVIHSDYLDAPLLRLVRRYLREQSAMRWQRAHLSRFTARSNLWRLCRAEKAAIKAVRRSCYVERVGGAGTFCASAKQLRNTRRLETKARTLFGDVEIETVRDSGGLLEAFERFIRIEASGWKSQEGTGSAIISQPSLLEFYRDLLASFGETGQARISLLRMGDGYAASQLALQANGAINLLKIGHDESYGAVGPGNILILHMLEHGHDGCSEINLLTAPRWAERWHFSYEPMFKLDFYNTTVRSTILRCLVSLSRLVK
jgi:CelD/BcsL family acetyltransferase involved in cellulose biosynthesis